MDRLRSVYSRIDSTFHDGQSQNGTRSIGSNSELIWGSFQSVPAELFVPCEGEQIVSPTQL